MITETVIETVYVGEIIREPGAVETVIETERTVELVTENVGPPGPPGPQGPPGQSFEFIQSTPATIWTIAHNLGFRPSVNVTTTGGLEIMGGVQHLSINVLSISFVNPVAGSAHLV